MAIRGCSDGIETEDGMLYYWLAIILVFAIGLYGGYCAAKSASDDDYRQGYQDGRMERNVNAGGNER